MTTTTASNEFHLPDVGEGLTEAEIVEWKVAPGDSVALNQVIVEIETAKSLVELPSPFAGVVDEILVEQGQTVAVGAPIIRVAGGDIPRTPADEILEAEADEAAFVAATPTSAASAEAVADEGSGSVLVGYGITGGHAATRRRRPTKGEADARVQRVAEAKKRRPESVPAASAQPVIVKPPIRKLAKDLGVDLAVVEATGLAGETTRDDVIRHAKQASVFHNIETPEWSEERVERIPVKGVRKAIASAMVSSAFTAPHVSLFVDVDATRTMEFVKRLKNSAQFAGVKVSPLLIMAKAVIWAVRRNPMVNSEWTDREILVSHFVNLGIAAATPRGLIVPNIKEAQAMSLLELAQALEELTLTARDGKTQPADTAGGTITITNIGVFGMDTGTPILNPGEVGIIALGTIKQKPWVVDGEVRPRMVTTIGASFDHRVVDGDVASRFVADVASVLEEPALLLD
ncbi:MULTISPECIES: dihydrolipoamide acetyltransferase family protein [unclassified Frondihabitans]|uniref:dihydrolipoamide acetyltransferase family protein n=1 Tax=unclassified Frondihabitans TaxID=2626248 RepID=UPI000F4FF5D6|nr:MULTISPECIES: dihydrolipoamide acetyltransferase family protein [unclassified Frondihabitans]RPE78022.1 pyruvate dehydrogenase E2 component (dihydrolipoamide acetyltransferase) [Frondihabitans sp. PhB153]RPF08302.1 pyruvate dehydrogenase E2 component (dihydrolipoamide acetyltransferase) [Frondihabitans sp. PhB161]